MLASAPRPLRALEWRTGETAALAGAASGATPESGATIVVRDPLGIAVGASPAQGSLSIAHEAWRVALAFDGRRTPEELARDLDVPAAAVRQAAEAFSRRLLLDDERARRAIDGARAEFERAASRALAAGGEGSGVDPLELRIRLAGLVADDWDMPPPADLEGLVAPSGATDAFAPLYARAYAALRHVHGRFARALVLAEGSAALGHTLVPLAKPFATPWGDQPCDALAVAALAEECGDDVLAHRGALGLERQALFLRLIAPRLPIVPVLVGPALDSELPRACAALERALALDGRTLVLAAVDLGERERAATAAAANARREADRAAVEPLLELEYSHFERLVAGASGRLAPRHAALALAARLLAHGRADGGRPLSGEVLGYFQSVADGALSTAVAIAFHRRGGAAREPPGGRA